VNSGKKPLNRTTQHMERISDASRRQMLKYITDHDEERSKKRRIHIDSWVVRLLIETMCLLG
jgi:hypothetical protein